MALTPIIAGSHKNRKAENNVKRSNLNSKPRSPDTGLDIILGVIKTVIEKVSEDGSKIFPVKN